MEQRGLRRISQGSGRRVSKEGLDLGEGLEEGRGCSSRIELQVHRSFNEESSLYI